MLGVLPHNCKCQDVFVNKPFKAHFKINTGNGVCENHARSLPGQIKQPKPCPHIMDYCGLG